MSKMLSSRIKARLSNIRAVSYWKEHSLLAPPCKHCVFEVTKMPDIRGRMKYYPIWVTCTNPEWGGPANDGCQWGNV